MATRDSDQIAAPLYSGIVARLLGGGWRRNREHGGNGGGSGNVCHVSMKTHLSVHHDSPPDELWPRKTGRKQDCGGGDGIGISVSAQDFGWSGLRVTVTGASAGERLMRARQFLALFFVAAIGATLIAWNGLETLSTGVFAQGPPAGQGAAGQGPAGQGGGRGAVPVGAPGQGRGRGAPPPIL